MATYDFEGFGRAFRGVYQRETTPAEKAAFDELRAKGIEPEGAPLIAKPQPG